MVFASCKGTLFGYGVTCSAKRIQAKSWERETSEQSVLGKRATRFMLPFRLFLQIRHNRKA